ncbi:MAG: [LysW]-lysine hydrolase [Anaerolineaceae bacterium]|nr:[LysW]-lysine hydrolase [Anaerolineaceae bacterium]
MNGPATLLGLVQHYSPSGQEEQAVHWLTEHMLSLGYDSAFVDEAGNAVGTRGVGAHQIVLLGHIDTVPGEISMRVENDILYGRGAVDAKGPLACFADAVARVTVPAGWQVVVIGAVGEEKDSRGAHFIKDRYRPDFAIIGEPNHWQRVALGYKGCALAEIRLHTWQQHSAGAGPTASEAAFTVWQSIRAFTDAYNADKSKMFEQVQASLLEIQSGQDGFEQWARLTVNTRLPLGLPPESWYAELEHLVGDATVKPLGNAIPAWSCEKNSALVRAFLAAIRAGGETPSFVYKTGTADLNIVAPVWGCPALVYGPGDSALDHTPQECLSLQEYQQAVEVVTAALHRLMV